jgi:uncharacterized membrane protein (DUF373 family)
MSSPSDDHRDSGADSGAGGGADGEPAGLGSVPRRRSSGLHGWLGAHEDSRWIWLLEHAQDVVTLAVGVVLIALAAILLVAAVVDFARTPRPVAADAQNLLDQVLLVLILVEVVHTVVITLRARRLIAQPFIVIGLIAVIRRILLVLTPATGTHSAVSTSELALLISMVAVFVASLIAIGHFERGHDSGEIVD